MRAHFKDALDELARASEPQDPAPTMERGGVMPGQWPGAPADRMPPDCPVVPLGIDGDLTYFVDASGQLRIVPDTAWSKKKLISLFGTQPNYIYWAWPRWSKDFTINGLEVDDAMQCLQKAAAMRGLFSPTDRVRGRGAWTTREGLLIWHAGDRLYTVDAGHLKCSPAGEVEGVFYPQRPPVTSPWQEPVRVDESPAQELLENLRSWNWERPEIDPLLVLGWIGSAFLGGALGWRPHLFAIGDKGVGKSTLQGVVKGLLDSALHACADTTPAGVYQRVKQDSLPVAIDELEAGADNRRGQAVLGLARLAASGAMMYRGGAEHEGVEFRLQNSFFFSSINPPPLEPQDRSRMAVVSLGKLKPGMMRKDPVIRADVTGRMILRSLMDGWKDWPMTLEFWRGAMRSVGLDSRAQDTYGTLLAMAHQMIGYDSMAKCGLPMTDEHGLGAWVAMRTANDRASNTDNWRDCLEHIFDSTIDAWKAGEKPTIGQVLEQWEAGELSTKEANSRLHLVGLAARGEQYAGGIMRDDLHPERMLLCVPMASVGLERLFAGKKWQQGVWSSALKQAPADVVIRNRGNGQNMKINRKTARVLFVDLAAYDRLVTAGDEEEEEGREV